LDFEQLEAFIHNNASVVQSPTSAQQPSTVDNSNQISNNQTNLPESPPDSGSEPPYSPNNGMKINQNIQMEHIAQQQQQQQQHINLNTLTELHVPQHHQHHLLTPTTELYLANEHHHQQQQLLQINNLLQNKQDGPLVSSSHHQSQDHMLLYQVNQSGQIIELNHIHQQTQQQMGNSSSSSTRMYKNDMMELETATPLPAIQEIQQSISNLNDNLMNEGFQRNALNGPEQALNGLGIVASSVGAIKKRKSSVHGFSNGTDDLKGYIKAEPSELCH
jgi:hypothetical protein